MDKIIDNYKNYTKVGQWGSMTVDKDGNFIPGSETVDGIIYSETIKVVEGEEIKLSSRYVMDKEVENEN